MISNEEFTWDRKGLTNVSPQCGAVSQVKISELEVNVAIGKMKKASQLVQQGLCQRCSRLQVKLVHYYYYYC